MNDPFDVAFGLLEDVIGNKCGVEDFQQKLEPTLNALPFAGDDGEEKFRQFSNRLEIMVYTLPLKDQPEAAKRLAEDIRMYLTHLREQKSVS